LTVKHTSACNLSALLLKASNHGLPLFCMLLPGELATSHPGFIPSSLGGHLYTTLCCTTSGHVHHVYFQAGLTFMRVQVWLDTEEEQA